jgi:hypothetical protein
VYLVVNDFGPLGRAFVKTDIAEADRETVIRNFLSGQYPSPLRVVASTPPRVGPATCQGTSRARCRNERSTRTAIWEKTPNGSSTGT